MAISMCTNCRRVHPPGVTSCGEVEVGVHELRPTPAINRPFEMPQSVPGVLRAIADAIENNPNHGWERCITLHHHMPVVDPAFGGMIVDNKFLGSTLIITSMNLAAVAARLTAECNKRCS